MRTLTAALVLLLAAAAPSPATAQSTDTELFLPIAARTTGVAETRWRTRAWFIATGDEAAVVTLEWYPMSAAGLSGPAAVSAVTVPAGGQLPVEDLVGELFGVNQGGAIRATSVEPFVLFARIVNTKMPPAFEGGTFGQAMPGLRLDQALSAGFLPGLSQEPISQESSFRTNLGYFNPGPDPTVLTAGAVTRAGELLGERTFTVPARSQWLGSVFDLIWTVPQDRRDERDFFVRFSVTGPPLFFYGSVVDNVTGDAVTLLPVAAGAAPG